MREHGIVPFELVVVNLYPFEATIAKPGVTDEEAIEQIDIGGPTLIRGGGEEPRVHGGGHCRPSSTRRFSMQIATHGGTTLELRRKLAGEAFEMIARVRSGDCRLFRRRHRQSAGERNAAADFPPSITFDLRRREVLRYGENPHQQAALYACASAGRGESGFRAAAARQGTVVQQSARFGCGTGHRSLAARARRRWSSSTTIRAARPAAGRLADSDAKRAGRRSGERLRRHRRGESTARCGDGRSAGRARSICRGDRRAGVRTGRRWKFSRPSRSGKRMCGCCKLARSTTPADAWQFRPIEGGFLMQEADVAADPESEWQVVTEQKPTRRTAGRTAIRLGCCAACEIERHRADAAAACWWASAPGR